MPAQVTLQEDRLTVDPGGEIGCQVRLRNIGTVVDQYSIEIVGSTASWATADPPVLPLFPDDEGVVGVRFRPPHAPHIRAGQVPFGVLVASHEDQTTALVEGVVEVGRFDDVVGELVPQTSRGRWSATHQLAVTNKGNAPLDISLDARDPDDLLRFGCKPAQLTVAPATVAFSQIKLRPRRRFWRGQPQTLPFHVDIQPHDAAPVVTDGAMLQEPILPKWLKKAALIALAAAVALLVLWFGLLKPQINSAAERAAARLGKDAKQAAAQAQQNAAQASKDAADAKKNADQLRDIAKNPNIRDVVEGTGGLKGTPFDHRLRLESPADRQERTDSLTVDKGKVLSVTDLVLENSQGDTGTLQLRRGKDILLSTALENFRTYDLHYVAPIMVNEGEQLSLAVTCTKTTAGDGKCRSALGLSGFTRDKGQVPTNAPANGQAQPGQ